ncbi:MAG TPA: ABC transporter substrate-binding protein [Thermomicrobiales bacterium]|nr:ABC transporter substrate-binding protein [Thermomicrobiales bacterium]
MDRDEGLEFLTDLLRGRSTRRTLLKRAAALGVSVPVAAGIGMVVPDWAAARQEASGTPVAPVGSITWALESDPVNLIPYGGVSTSNMWGKQFMYESLLQWDKDLKIQPALAESFEAAADATSYTFHLRKGVKFHDGGELTAKDVKYSVEMALNPPPPGIQVAFLQNIAGVDVVDDYTAKINMTKPDPTLPGTIAWARYLPIIPDGVFDRINVLSEGIGTGPFKLVSFSPNDETVYTAFPDYWNPGIPCVKDLTLKVLTDEQQRVASLRAGEIDGCTLTADVAQTLEKDNSVEVLSGLYSAPHVIHLNTVKDVPWRDERVRQAISKMIDRQEIIDKVYAGKADLTGPIPPGYGDWPLSDDELKKYYTVDKDGAKKLMADAGFADGFKVTLQAISAPREYTQIAEIVRERLKEIKIEVQVEPLEIGTFAKNNGDGTFEWQSTGRGMRGDPSGFLVDYRTGTALNVKWFGDGWKNDEVNQLYDEALATSDVATRHKDYTRIQEILLEGAVNLFTVQPYKFQVVRKRLTGMYVSYTDFNEGLARACVTGD